MPIHFILNQEPRSIDLPPGLPLLDYLRDSCGLTAAKAGCREGECGSCSVLLGQLNEQGQLRYHLVNSCLLPLGALAGCHLLTLEGLGTAPTPVQQQLVDAGGIQCGFCSPGMVLALTAHLLNALRLDRPHLLESLDGNLCRCTGYMGIKRAGEELQGRFADLPDDPAERLAPLIAAGVLPAWLDALPARLAALPRPSLQGEPKSDEPILAGGTDLLLQRPALLADHEPWFVTEQPDLHGIRIEAGRVHIGATTQMQALLDSTELAEQLPELHRALGHIASTPVRERATLGGNLVNASPIGDLPILLLALGAELTLRSHQRLRQLPLSEFFLDYKQLALEQDELLSGVAFDLPAGQLHFEKVAHRDHLDIASVNCALLLALDGEQVVQIRLAAGGVGPTPLRLREVEALLLGQPLSEALAAEAARLAAASVRPHSDLRGTARYKALLLRQLIVASLLACAPGSTPSPYWRRCDGRTATARPGPLALHRRSAAGRWHAARRATARNRGARPHRGD